MKLFVHYEPSEAGTALGAVNMHTMKAGLPKTWYEQPVSKVKSLFVDAYHSKHGVQLKPDEWVLITAENKPVADTDIISASLSSGTDLRMRPAASAGRATAASSTVTVPDLGPGQVRCKNYGCNKGFRDEDNGPSACSHHTAPPCFNDVRKWWACCKERVAYDWPEFMTLEGCATGPHSATGNQSGTFAPSPRTAAALASGASAPAAVPKSIESYNASNPAAVTAASSVARTMTSMPAAVRRDEDGAYRCINKGCQQQWFQLGDNHDQSCVYHSGQPIFHDGGKRWSCCSADGKGVAWSFEEFMAIPGCSRGRHEAGKM